MKKLLFFFMSLCSFIAFGQLSEDFENPAFPPPGWVVTDNGIGTVQSWEEILFCQTLGLLVLLPLCQIVKEVCQGLAQDWLITPQVTVPANGQVRFLHVLFSRRARECV